MSINIAVVGESCKDEYVYGTCERVCPEAAALCFKRDGDITSNPGMAANVYQNLLALNKHNTFKIDLISSKSNIIKRRFVDKKYNTIIFREDINDQSDRIQLNEIDFDKYSYIIFSDYNKGFLTEEDIINICLKHKRHTTVFIDTKKKLKNISPFVNFIKINTAEFLYNQEDVDFLKEQTSLIVTSGEFGAILYEKGNMIQYPTQKAILRDVCGAGDTFLAGLVFEYCKTHDIHTAIKFANVCATSVVSRFGVVTL